MINLNTEVCTIGNYKTRPPGSKDLITSVRNSLDDDKAKDINVINLSGKTSFADYMIIATGTSQRHVANMANHICNRFKKIGLKSVPVEGLSQGNWVLIDGGDIIIHLFRTEFREFYDLDNLWGTHVPTPDRAA